MTTKSNIKEKIEYETGKYKNLEEKIIKEGGRFNLGLIKLDAGFEVIKDILFKEGLADKDEFELEHLKKAQIILERILEMVKKIKKESSKIIVPGMVPPKDLRKVRA